MVKKKHPVIGYSTTYFEVQKFTKTNIRHTCNRTGLFQECRIRRGGDDYVHIRYKEFSGTVFWIRVSLKAKTITLVEPDHSWLPEVNHLVRGIAQTVEQILGKRRSTKQFTLERRIEYLSQ